MNYAVIDIGTLKVKFLIASIEDGKLVKKYESNTLTCFGCEMDANSGFALEKNIDKTINELLHCKKILEKHEVKKFRVVSTHAMRRAKNRKDILKRIKKEVGFEVENITQKKEAELFFLAVMRDFAKTNIDYAVLDVGGGSLQILLGNPHKLRKIHMMQTGAQYLHDNFTVNPASEKSITTLKDIEKMKEHILHELMPLKKESGLPIVYGSSMIIDIMRDIQLHLDPHENSQTHPYKTYAEHLEKFIEKIASVPYSRREKMFDLQKGYMWGIDKAFINVVTVANHFRSPYIIPSNANIAQGFVYDMAE